MATSDIVLVSGGLGPTKDDVTKAIQNTFYLMEKAVGLTYVTALQDPDTAVSKPYYKTDNMKYMLEGVNPEFLAMIEAEMIDEEPPAFDLIASMAAVSPADYQYPAASGENKWFAV